MSTLLRRLRDVADRVEDSSRFFPLILALISLPFMVWVTYNVATKLRFEDALIVLRYARNLAEGHGFVYNIGERILGVTTPLYTLISTFFYLANPAHAPTVQNTAGVIFLVLEAGLAGWIIQRVSSPVLAAWVSVLILTNLNFNYLYFGMETHFFTLLSLLAFYLYWTDREVGSGIVLGLAFLTRYDAALLALLIGLAILIEKRRLPLRLTAAFFAVVTPWLVFAVAYFGTILPNPLGAKQDYYPTIAYVRVVFGYYREYFSALTGIYIGSEGFKEVVSWLFPFVCLAGVWSLVRAAPRLAVLITFAAMQVLVYAALGPDPAFRWHYYFLNPMLTMLFCTGAHSTVTWLASKVFAERGRLWVTGLTTILLVLASVHLLRGVRHEYQPDPHTQQLYVMAEWLNEHYDDETSLLQPSIGILGYATNLRMIDHAGLVTPGLYYLDGIRHTPMDEVLSRHSPDLILVLEGVGQDLAEHGYRQVARFEDPHTYNLYESINRLDLR